MQYRGLVSKLKGEGEATDRTFEMNGIYFFEYTTTDIGPTWTMTSRLLTELIDMYERERRANELINSIHLRLSHIEHENEQMKQTLSYAASRMKRHDTAS